jgi:hypothetical protein
MSQRKSLFGRLWAMAYAFVLVLELLLFGRENGLVEQ